MTDEWFDIYDDEGLPIGQASRQETHRNGYWHQTFHCWLYELRNGHPYLIFQRRQHGKDTNPLCFDITVAGHLSAGETVSDAVRELKEEIGVEAAFHQLKPLMTVREDAQGTSHGERYWDREVSHVFAFENIVPMHNWSLQPEEVLAIYSAPLDELELLFKKEGAKLQVTGYLLSEEGTLIADEQLISMSQFVPRSSSYYLEVIEHIRKLTAFS